MKKKQVSLKELSEHTKTTLIGNPDLLICNVDTLEDATPQDAAFLANPRYKEAMKLSEAGVICVDRKTDLIAGKNFLISEDPSRTFQMIAEILFASNQDPSGFQGIHPSAVIHESVQIGKGVRIGPFVVVDRNAIIGDRTHILSSSYIGAEVVIGQDCMIYPGAMVRERSILGNRVILQPGAVIGSCGFGYTTDPKTGKHTKLAQIGNVILEDDVEIGANSTIDRARFKHTLIKKGTKIDNLVQIAHNVELGENNVIVSQSGIAGSSTLGNNVFLGGQAGVVGHVEITHGVTIATRGGNFSICLSAHQIG
ncbi:MAG: UDP-3-O-(3-hydroxymyristoyl)glucosamine N-acyltransferase [Simkania negevensis]|nr:UDP-3-O-(3-hydroxymyristoyl)glucosamine N-acyltransferase [Simkania negevensis]